MWRAQWNTLHKQLAAFKCVHAHYQVPKGFKQDKKLANWVWNQWLEYANKLQGKKNCMTEDQQVQLEALAFKWSAGSSNLSGPVVESSVILTDEAAVNQITTDKAAVDQTIHGMTELE